LVERFRRWIRGVRFPTTEIDGSFRISATGKNGQVRVKMVRPYKGVVWGK
jgi:hypothetical protein